MLKVCSFNGSVSVHHRFVDNVNVLLIKARSPLLTQSHNQYIFISSYYEICDILLMYKQLKTVLLCQMGDNRVYKSMPISRRSSGRES